VVEEEDRELRHKRTIVYDVLEVCIPSQTCTSLITNTSSG
jgi:hypothetical protein